MRKLVFAISLSVIMLSFGSCVGSGYVSEEPTYVEVARPPRPSAAHVWIEGDWVWSGSSHSYYRRNGSWMVPRGGRSYSPGYWQAGPRGHHWRSGHWR